MDLSKFDENFLNKSLQKRFAQTDCFSEESYREFLEENKNERECLIDSLQISYSEFFRNSLTFSVLEKIILPALLFNNSNTRRKEIRIWSAACAAGQETYSISMLLTEIKNGMNETNNFRIFATDQSKLQVDEAQRGVYCKAALENVSLKRINQWFTNEGDTYAVKEKLKVNIDFSVFDLFSEQFTSPPSSIFGEFDLVICANLLFYYKPEFQNKILGKAANCLANGGYLVTGESERDILLRLNYREVFPHSAIFQK